MTICRYCRWEIEPCLERRTGWKHVQPWMAEDLRCGGKAQPLTDDNEASIVK